MQELLQLSDWEMTREEQSRVEKRRSVVNREVKRRQDPLPLYLILIQGGGKE
jgi:hypothetical protein